MGQTTLAPIAERTNATFACRVNPNLGGPSRTDSRGQDLSSVFASECSRMECGKRRFGPNGRQQSSASQYRMTSGSAFSPRNSASRQSTNWTAGSSNPRTAFSRE
jgi:hypothetical protein